MGTISLVKQSLIPVNLAQPYSWVAFILENWITESLGEHGLSILLNIYVWSWGQAMKYNLNCWTNVMVKASLIKGTQYFKVNTAAQWGKRSYSTPMYVRNALLALGRSHFVLCSLPSLDCGQFNQGSSWQQNCSVKNGSDHFKLCTLRSQLACFKVSGNLTC